MQLFSEFRNSVTCTAVALVVSFIAAAFLNRTTYAWPLVERMPQPLVEAVGRVLLVIFWPLLPSGVDEQEELLELLLVWVFSGLALIPIFVFVGVVRHDLRRRHTAQTKPSLPNESNGKTSA
jgi:hypothetical protein